MPFSIRSYRRFLPLPCCSGFWVLITLLVLTNGPAYGEWVWASSNDQVGLTIFIDPDTIRRNGDLVKLWQLYDYKTIQTVGGDSFLSSKARAMIESCVWQDRKGRRILDGRPRSSTFCKE